ncbi:glycoside hydrolase family 9 protein [Agriterribacter sp.]|uniref:glycoside hydrolase family 9 protein n=1 Tax=Agriterribacter sp. TaxID=2821509 RepID=UPI002B7B3AC7|nr:glycoside hydrolase family 9 protein [Agriterribacter sp.]HRP56326.1 glycoside hydrolase family 9 protein [Agriterribacter sp.]
MARTAATLLFVMVWLSFLQAQPSTNIQLNQAGFYTHAPKIAVVTSPAQSGIFYLLSADKKDTLYKGILSAPENSAYSSTATSIADFSAFSAAGVYILFVPDAGYSYPFNISNDIHRALSAASLKSYYYQRMSMPILPQYAGKWARAGGHPDKEVLIHPSAASGKRPAHTVISSPGGWYDAGDYNKYIVNSGITMGTLLTAYEDFPLYFDTLQTNIPETGNGLPDIINETLYNLRWMLTMQDPNDGGVYHKCTNAAFDKMIMPAGCHNPRYVVQKSTAAALDFAAVMAQASRILVSFKKQLPGLNDSCLHAAQYAWHWAKQNPAVLYDQRAMNALYQPAVTTGAYGDNNIKDEWFWAACELLATTGKEAYIQEILHYRPAVAAIPSWNNVAALGSYTLLRYKNTLSKYRQLNLPAIEQQVIDLAGSLVGNGGNRAFRTIMGQSKKDFIWGSNAVAMNQGIVLINAYLLTKDKHYIAAALTNADYIMGRNATGFCFVTGMGSRSPVHIHHRLSVADGITQPIPGLLAGGPNPGMQDKCKYVFTEPETAYTDTDCSYASNETAINWNAPLVYVSGALEALQYELAYSVRK